MLCSLSDSNCFNNETDYVRLLLNRIYIKRAIKEMNPHLSVQHAFAFSIVLQPPRTKSR